jgi:hypothetical protein
MKLSELGVEWDMGAPVKNLAAREMVLPLMLGGVPCIVPHPAALLPRLQRPAVIWQQQPKAWHLCRIVAAEKCCTSECL